MFWISLNVFGSLRSLLGVKDWPAEIKKHPTKNKYAYIWKKISYALETWPYITQNIAIPNKECNIEVVFVYLRHMEILIFNCPVVVTSSLEGSSGEVVGQLRLIVWTLEIVAMVGRDLHACHCFMFIVSDIPTSAYNTGTLWLRENDETHRVLEIYILEDQYM